ncbi:MAG TPA: hypothetical protein VHN98_05240 [Acidimicrobiales bacterium]|nr:hypothetical protein [Acidimicrobiales bacterium]
MPASGGLEGGTMYLFTRMARLAATHVVDGVEWAATITDKVNQITSLDVGLWASMLSPRLGAVSWGCAVESLADLEDADAKLMADPIYLDLVTKGATITTGEFDDLTAQYVFNPAPDLDAKYVAVVQGQLANGAFGRGMGVGVEIAERATAIAGGTASTSFLVGVTGGYGSCAWITGAATLRDLERAEQAVNTSAEFIALIDEKAADCFLPGVTTQEIWRRLH